MSLSQRIQESANRGAAYIEAGDNNQALRHLVVALRHCHSRELTRNYGDEEKNPNTSSSCPCSEGNAGREQASLRLFVCLLPPCSWAAEREVVLGSYAAALCDAYWREIRSSECARSHEVTHAS